MRACVRACVRTYGYLHAWLPRSDEADATPPAQLPPSLHFIHVRPLGCPPPACGHLLVWNDARDEARVPENACWCHPVTTSCYRRVAFGSRAYIDFACASLHRPVQSPHGRR